MTLLLPNTAVRYNPSFLSRFCGMVFLSIVLTFGDFGYIVVSTITSWNQEIRSIPASILLASVAMTVGIVFTGVILSIALWFLPRQRLPIFLPPLIATILVSFANGALSAPSDSKTTEVTIGVIVAPIIIVDLASAPVTPNYGDGPRFYFTAGRVTDKE